MSGGLEIKGEHQGNWSFQAFAFMFFLKQIQPLFVYICRSLTEHCNLVIWKLSMYHQWRINLTFEYFLTQRPMARARLRSYLPHHPVFFLAVKHCLVCQRLLGFWGREWEVVEPRGPVCALAQVMAVNDIEVISPVWYILLCRLWGNTQQAVSCCSELLFDVYYLIWEQVTQWCGASKLFQIFDLMS